MFESETTEKLQTSSGNNFARVLLSAYFWIVTSSQFKKSVGLLTKSDKERTGSSEASSSFGQIKNWTAVNQAKTRDLLLPKSTDSSEDSFGPQISLNVLILFILKKQRREKTI